MIARADDIKVGALIKVVKNIYYNCDGCADELIRADTVGIVCAISGGIAAWDAVDALVGSLSLRTLYVYEIEVIDV